MSRCPTCGALVRDPIARTQLDALRRLDVELSARGHSFSFDSRRTEDGNIKATLNGKPMIGCRSPEQLRRLAEAMTDRLADGRPGLADPVPS